MSDSDSELLETNPVFAFQNENTTVIAKGPNINANNLTGISFRHNVLTSTMNMPRNYEWQRRAESNYDQRSMGYRRGTSPMSIVSACDARQRKFNCSNYSKAMSSQRSVYNERAGSPMSMRSMDSNATISASDIAMAFKTNQFNNKDIRVINEALNKYKKQTARMRIEKRRNLKLFRKGYRRKSGYDSGELGSNSSISSDDNRSTKTSNYKYNMSSCRSTKTDVADLRRTIKESNMFDDCTDNFRQNRMQGMFSRPKNLNASSLASSFRSQIEKPFSTKSMPPPVNFTRAQSQNSVTQQDRFKNGFLLPSQRFNRSVAALSIPETAEKLYHSERNKQNVKFTKGDLSNTLQEVSSDENEDIFLELTAVERPPINQRKRSVDSDDDDIGLPIQKKARVASPCKNMSQSFKNSTVIEKAKNDFEFAKPAFPVRKSANLKAKEKIPFKSADMSTTERLISKSRGPLSDSIVHHASPPKQLDTTSQPKEVVKEQTEKDDNMELSTVSQNRSDLSMRPSFIRRKLYSQNMDVTKKTDILAANSPLNSIYGATQNKKNKARKLVTSQNCLRRDIQSDGNNLLDLIHKIVPAERMNASNQTNKITVQNNMSEDNDDKWDVTSIISARNNDENVSDTFTDEDAVLADDGKVQPSPKLPRKPTPPKLVTEKKIKKSPPKKGARKVLVEENGTPINTVQKYVKTFWDTDFESDAERTPTLRKSEAKENKRTITPTGNIAQNATSKEKFRGFSSMFPAKTSLLNSTVDTVQKFNNTNKSLRLYSHRNNKSNVKKTVQEKIKEDAKSAIEPQSKKEKATKTESIVQKKQENPKPKQGSKKSPSKRLTNKETPKKAQEKDPVKEQTSKNDRILRSAEKNKSQNKTRTGTIESKPQEKNKITEKIVTENKPQNNKKTNTVQNKKEVKTPKKSNTSKPQSNKTSDLSSNNKQNNKKGKHLKADSPHLDTTVANNRKNQKSRTVKVTLNRLSDYIFYMNSFTETNNNKSMRPVRSCRNSKHNRTDYSR